MLPNRFVPVLCLLCRRNKPKPNAPNHPQALPGSRSSWRAAVVCLVAGAHQGSAHDASPSPLSSSERTPGDVGVALASTGRTHRRRLARRRSRPPTPPGRGPARRRPIARALAPAPRARPAHPPGAPAPRRTRPPANMANGHRVRASTAAARSPSPNTPRSFPSPPHPGPSRRAPMPSSAANRVSAPGLSALATMRRRLPGRRFRRSPMPSPSRPSSARAPFRRTPPRLPAAGRAPLSSRPQQLHLQEPCPPRRAHGPPCHTPARAHVFGLGPGQICRHGALDPRHRPRAPAARARPAARDGPGAQRPGSSGPGGGANRSYSGSGRGCSLAPWRGVA